MYVRYVRMRDKGLTHIVRPKDNPRPGTWGAEHPASGYPALCGFRPKVVVWLIDMAHPPGPGDGRLACVRCIERAFMARVKDRLEGAKVREVDA